MYSVCNRRFKFRRPANVVASRFVILSQVRGTSVSLGSHLVLSRFVHLARFKHAGQYLAGTFS